MADGSDVLTTIDFDDYIVDGPSSSWFKKVNNGITEYSVPWQDINSNMPSGVNITGWDYTPAYLGQYQSNTLAEVNGSNPLRTVNEEGLTFEYNNNTGLELADVSSYAIPVNGPGATIDAYGYQWFEGIFTLHYSDSDMNHIFYWFEDADQDDPTVPRGSFGTVSLRNYSGEWKFEFSFRDYSSGNVRFSISEAIPVGVPVYYRIARSSYGSASTPLNEIHTFITDGITTLTDATYNPGNFRRPMSSVVAEEVWFGGVWGNYSGGGNARISHHWTQAGWSADVQAQSTGFSSYLTNPKMRADSVKMIPQSLTTNINGDNTGSNYKAQAFSNLEIPGGTVVGLLHHAQDNETADPTSSLVADIAQNINSGTSSVTLVDIETGLHLYCGFQLNCGGPLNRYTPIIRDDGNGVITEVFFEDTPTAADYITLSLGGEGAGEAQLPFMPDYPAEERTTYQFTEHAYEYPYVHIHGTSTGYRKEWDLSWTLDQADAETLIAFFDARRGGEGAFTFYTPDDQTNLQKAALVGEIVAEQLAGEQAYKVSATVREVK